MKINANQLDDELTVLQIREAAKEILESHRTLKKAIEDLNLYLNDNDIKNCKKVLNRFKFDKYQSLITLNYHEFLKRLNGSGFEAIIQAID